MDTPENCTISFQMLIVRVYESKRSSRSHWISRCKSNRMCDVHIKYIFCSVFSFFLQSFMFHGVTSTRTNFIPIEFLVFYFLCWNLSPAECFIRNRLNWVARQITSDTFIVQSSGGDSVQIYYINIRNEPVDRIRVDETQPTIMRFVSQFKK